MISCEHCEELINARLDEYLTPQDARLLEEHLAQCPDCQKLDRDLTALHIQLSALTFDPPADLIPTILSQLEVPPMQSNTKKKKAPWAAIACAAAAVALMAVVLIPQVSPFGNEAGDTAAAETMQEPQSTTTDTAPAEGAEQQESQPETEEVNIDPLTEKQALKFLNNYLDEVGYAVEISEGTLSEDASFWTFSGRSSDSGERFLFNIYCSDGFVEEVMLP